MNNIFLFQRQSKGFLFTEKRKVFQQPGTCEYHFGEDPEDPENNADLNTQKLCQKLRRKVEAGQRSADVRRRFDEQIAQQIPALSSPENFQSELQRIGNDVRTDNMNDVNNVTFLVMRFLYQNMRDSQYSTNESPLNHLTDYQEHQFLDADVDRERFSHSLHIEERDGINYYIGNMCRAAFAKHPADPESRMQYIYQKTLAAIREVQTNIWDYNVDIDD